MPLLRPDRVATLYLFRPLRRLLRRPSPGIPILMYHSISTRVELRRSAYFHTCTDPQVFRNHLKFLASNGYKIIGLAEAARKLKGGNRTDEKLVVLTFDDGYADFYTEAFPILSAYGYTATVFLPTAYIGDNSRTFNGTTCLTWSEVRKLQSTGIDFGSHTVTHPQLRTLPMADLNQEVRCSKEEIEQKLGSKVRSFSYPYAFPETDRRFKQALRQILDEAGYETGVSTVIGTADHRTSPLFMRRLPVNSCDDPRFFEAKISGAYDWLHGPQRFTKMLECWRNTAEGRRATCIGSAC